MKAALALLALGLTLTAPVSATAEPAAQPLSITFHGDGARATQLTQYDPSVPIAVNVRESGGLRVDRVSVTAAGPAGEALETPLNRVADGSFRGTVTLADPGAWTIHLKATIGKIRTETSPVTLDLEAPPPSNAWQVGLGVGAGVFIVIGGTGFFLLRRLMAVPSKSGRAQTV
jgi:hypothetical protein